MGKRINRNIVECKLLQILVKWFVVNELIETLWNVNQRKTTVKRRTV